MDLMVAPGAAGNADTQGGEVPLTRGSEQDPTASYDASSLSTLPASGPCVPTARAIANGKRRESRSRLIAPYVLRSAIDAGVLELVEVGPVEEVEHAVDVVGILPIHQAHEHRALADDERRHAEHVPALVGFGVLFGQHLQGPSGRNLGGDGVGVETNRCRDLREDLGLRDLEALVVAGCER